MHKTSLAEYSRPATQCVYSTIITIFNTGLAFHIVNHMIGFNYSHPYLSSDDVEKSGIIQHGPNFKLLAHPIVAKGRTRARARARARARTRARARARIRARARVRTRARASQS